MTDVYAMADAHRLLQVRLTAGVIDDVRKTWPLLDFSALDRSFQAYSRALIPLLAARREVSAALASAHYRQLRDAAGVHSPYEIQSAAALPVEAVTTSLAVTGPSQVKASLSRGADPAQALSMAMAATVRSAQRHVTNGGRETMLDTALLDDHAHRYQRVSDGHPCSFCAMLVSRGAVYKSGDAWSGGFHSHDGCHCYPVPLFSRTGQQYARAREFRDLWNETNRPLGKAQRTPDFGEGEARARFRRAYQKKYGAPPSSFTDKVAITGADASTATAEVAAAALSWRGKFDDALGRLGDTSALKKEAGLLTEDEAKAALAEVKAEIDRLQTFREEIVAVGEDYAAFSPELKAWVDREVARGADPNEIARHLTNVRMELAGNRASLDMFITADPKGVIDRSYSTLDKGPGAKINAQLDAILDAGTALDDELEARVLAREAEYLPNVDEAEIARLEATLEDTMTARGDGIERIRADFMAGNKEPFKDWVKYLGKDYSQVDNIVDPVLDMPADLVGAWRAYELNAYSHTAEGAANNALDEETRIRLRKLNDLKAKGRIEEEYRRVVREEAINLLAEVRPMGGKTPPLYRGSGAAKTRRGTQIKSGELVKSFDAAYASYPEGWAADLQDFLDNGPFKGGFNVAKADRGFNVQGGIIVTSDHGVKMAGFNALTETTIHEIGHSYEHIYPGLKRLEWAYHWRRTGVRLPDGTIDKPVIGTAPKTSNGYATYGPSEQFVPENDFADIYTSKVYKGNNPEASWEVFTTGIQSLMGGGKLFDKGLGRNAAGEWTWDSLRFETDRNFRAFILGVMSVL